MQKKIKLRTCLSKHLADNSSTVSETCAFDEGNTYKEIDLRERERKEYIYVYNVLQKMKIGSIQK